MGATVTAGKFEVNDSNDVECRNDTTLQSSIVSNMSDNCRSEETKESSRGASYFGNDILSLQSRQTHSIHHVPSKKRKKINIDNQNHIWRNVTSSHDTQVYPNQHSKKVKVQTEHWPKKFNLSFHESLEQMTKIPIYSLSFSEPQPCDNVDDNNNNNNNNDNDKNDDEISLNVTINPATSTTTTFTVRLLATCTGRNLVLYRITEKQQLHLPLPTLPVTNNLLTCSSIDKECTSSTIQLAHCFTDTEPNEEYYACTFVGPPVPQLVCVAGKNARINIIDCTRQCVIRTLSGHGDEIYDLQVCPTNYWLLLSASKDCTCRLWNVRAIHHSPVAIFGGHNGHCDAVITISWHALGDQFVSGGLDNTIKIWEISDRVKNAITSSNQFTDMVRSSQEPIDQCSWIATALIQFPIFSTKRVHAHCVDCVEFLGDLILSKSTENLIQLWYPMIQNERTPFGDIIQPPSSDPLILYTYNFDDGDIWFVRFAIEPTLKLLAVGNILGKIFVWNIGDDRLLKPICKLCIRRTSTIRCLCFSPNGSMLLASTDDGSIYQWILTLE
jgi:polycomb protein EED